MAKARIATIKGVWIRPGRSRNGRLYTKEHIAQAAQEAQEAIDSGDGDVLAMMTHHGARDPRQGDSTRIAGRLTKVGVDADGNGTFEGELADTQAGRDIAALVTPEHPFLKTVSMASVWKAEPHTVRTADGPAEYADGGFSMRGIDFVSRPGVPGAEITSASPADASQPAEASAAGLIFEEAEEVAFVEAPIAEAAKPKKKPRGVTPAIKRQYVKDLKGDTAVDIAAGMRRLCEWVAQGHMPRGTTYADLKWFYDQAAAELKRRNPKSKAGGNFPAEKGA